MPILTLSEGHKYFLGDKKLDGLTSTIKEAGLIRNGDEWYLQRGSAVHLAAQFYDEGTLNEFTVDPRIKGYLDSWERFRADQNYTPSHIEWQIYHPELMVGMTIDRLPGPKDLKSGTPEPWHVLQISCQWATLKAQGLSELIKDPMDIYLDESGGPPKIRLYNTWELREAFKVYASILYFLRWRREKYGSSNR